MPSRETNSWIITAKLKGPLGYNALDAFEDLGRVHWHKSNPAKNIKSGDYVYVYIGEPYSKIMIKTVCIESSSTITPDLIDLELSYYNDFDSFPYGIGDEHFLLEEVARLDTEKLSLDMLKDLGLVKTNIQGVYSSENNPELFDYIENCFENIDDATSSSDGAKMVDAINYDKLHKLEEAFIIYEIAKHGVDPRDTLESTTLRINNLEGYKRNSFDKLHSKIEAGGPYSEILLEAFNNNNLASYRQKPSIEAIVNSDKAELLESALASLYEGEDDKAAFNEVVNIVGRNFDVVGLIFFLKDCDKYLPIRSSIFDRLFTYVDVKAGLAANCSWDKYQAFISAIKDIQEDLKKNVNVEFSLLDAHSFVWILEGIQRYLNSGAQIVEHDKLGKGVVQSVDDERITVKFADSKTPVTLLKSIAIDEGKLIFIEPHIDIDGNKASEKEDKLREAISKAEAAGNNKYIVLHSRQGTGEYLNGYINTPYHSKDGKSLHYWDILSDIKAGDVLFHYCGGEIQAISTVTKDCYDRTLEPQLGETDIWGSLRRQVEFKPIVLDKSLNLLEMKAVIVKYRNEKYSAFNKNGGANEGYVYNLEPKLAEIFENKIGIIKTDGDYSVADKQSISNDIKAPSSKVYIVFRGGSYTDETSNYIWALKQDASGGTPHYWERMTEVKPGDIIFQYKDGYIKAVSTAATRCYDEDRYIHTDTNENWNREGRRIDLNTTILDDPIRLSDFQNSIIKYRKEKYSAFNKNGGANQGYLYELEPELAELFMKEVESYLPEKEDNEVPLSDKAIEVTEALLTLIVNRQRVTTYSELSEMTASKPSPYYEMNGLLDSINRVCDDLELPYISAMVVNKSTGLPGEGFRKLCIDVVGYDPELTTQELFDAELDKIGKCDKWNKLAAYVGINMPTGKEEETLPEEVEDEPGDPIIEGAKKTITVNAYERDPKAKRICKDHYMKLHGRITCQVCGFDFGKVYGPEYSNRIHIHHIVPVSEIGEEYEVDPINDLIPVCPNCHMVLHLGNGISVDELKKKL